MKRASAAMMCTVAMALASAANAAAQDWQVVPEESSLGFEVAQGSSTVSGEFEEFTSDIVFDPQDPQNASVTVEIDMSSLDLGGSSATEQALSSAWLAANQHETASYEAHSFTRQEGDTYEVEADLTIRGVTQQVRHPVTISVNGDRATAQGTVPVMRMNYGVGEGTGGDTVALTVDVMFDIRATAG